MLRPSDWLARHLKHLAAVRLSFILVLSILWMKNFLFRERILGNVRILRLAVSALPVCNISFSGFPDLKSLIWNPHFYQYLFITSYTVYLKFEEVAFLTSIGCLKDSLKVEL